MNDQWDRVLRAEAELQEKTREYFLRGQVVAVCEAMLAEEAGIISSARRLNSLSQKLSQHEDPDFKLFRLIDSDTDHLPVDSERNNWSLEALKQKDKEIAEVEAFYKENGKTACRRLIDRFDVEVG